MAAFDDAWRKWEWGGSHAKKLKACFPANASTRPYFIPTVESTYDPDTECIVLHITDIGPPPAEWGLRLGDVVANYRASLDHLAWAVVMRGDRADSLTDGKMKGVYYPVTIPGSQVARVFKRNLPGATEADLAIIRRYQPEHVGEEGQSHCLTTLQRASNLDKHRSLQPMPLCVGESELSINQLEDCVLVDEGFSIVTIDPIQPGSELGRILVRPTGPSPRAYMNGRFGLRLAIDGKVWLLQWLTEIQRFIGQLLAEFSEPPTGVLYVPPDFFDSAR